MIENYIDIFMSRDSATVQSNKIINQLPLDKWPEDEWYSISHNWDLNVSLDYYDEPCAILYQVSGGQTDTSRPWRIL